MSQEYSPSLNIDVGWKTKKRTSERRVKVPKFAKALAKEQFERNKLCRKPLPPKPEPKPGEMSALEKFKLGIKKLEMVKNENQQGESPKTSKTDKPSFSKKKENVTRSFMFGLSDDSDDEGGDEAYSSWNSLIRKFDHFKENQQLQTTPTKSNDDNWRKTKSAQELNTSSSNKPISEPLKDLFDDSISDSLLLQCSQQVEKKLASTKSPITSTKEDNLLDNDSFDEMLSSFPLEEIVQKSQVIETIKQSSSFSRHNSMPCQSKIASIVQKVNKQSAK